MVKDPNNTDVVRFNRAADLGGLESLHARFVRHSFPRHTHETFAIGVIENGVQATLYNGATHIATPMDICLVNPGEVHTGFAPQECGWTYRVFYPEPALLQKVAREISADSREYPCFSSPVIRDRELASGLFSFLLALEESDVSLHRESLLLSVLAMMIGRHGDVEGNRTPGRQKGGRAVRRAREYLDACFTENVSLPQLAHVAKMSEFHLLRLFRSAVGLPPHAYMIQKRIDLARMLLSRGLPIAQVALETGFVDQSHLTRWFSRIVGITPGQYRRNEGHGGHCGRRDAR